MKLQDFNNKADEFFEKYYRLIFLLLMFLSLMAIPLKCIGLLK